MNLKLTSLFLDGALLTMGSQAALAAPDWSKAPTDGFDHSDKDNEVKATVMFPNDKVPMGDQVGCWAACHKDARTMPAVVFTASPSGTPTVLVPMATSMPSGYSNRPYSTDWHG